MKDGVECDDFCIDDDDGFFDNMKLVICIILAFVIFPVALVVDKITDKFRKET